MTLTIDERYTDNEFTAAGNVRGTFGYDRVLESITIHHYGAFGQRAEDVVDFFLNRNWTTSAHFVAGSNKVWCLVSPANAAWAAGNAYGNATSIHIECQPEATDADYRLVAELVRFLRQHYGNLPLKMHREWSATACPGIWDMVRLERTVSALGTPVPPAPPAPPVPKPSTPSPAPYVADVHWQVEKNDTLDKIAKWAGVTVDELAVFNGIPDANKIRIGERIWNPRNYYDTWNVEKNDTLASIVEWYKRNYGRAVDLEKLKNVNGINNPWRDVKIGMRLVIPN